MVAMSSIIEMAFEKSTFLPLNAKEITSRLDAELLGVWKDRRSSSAARPATALKSLMTPSSFNHSIVLRMGRSFLALLFRCSSRSDDWLGQLSATLHARSALRQRPFEASTCILECANIHPFHHGRGKLLRFHVGRVGPMTRFFAGS